jgi:uncharacterized membrane protein
VFLLGAIPWVEIAAVIPLALSAGLHPLFTGIFAFLGNLSTVYLVIVFFEKVKERRQKKKGGGEERAAKRRERAAHVFHKYGLPGLALLGPLLIGSHIAAFLGLLFGAKKHWTLLWMTISLAAWTVIITVVSMSGIDLYHWIRQ